MLAGVLLHVVGAARPVNDAFDLRAGEQRLWGQMPDFAVLVFFHLDDRRFESRAAGRGGARVPVSCGWPPLVG